jgi:site-specific DNA recombinase
MARADTSRRGAYGIRCAVYTRKSSEEGLEQDFNSLHAQREACEAFIKSQKHEDWRCLPESYNDGGISGATIDRPALQQLLADVHAGKVDVIVVYKVDRLTRSLADVAKIVEILDAKGASFVSVTQQFNTTTSMGRLTLNVLLSFAQFEREVTGERIRDKIAASKKKGMWMGGTPPLGYEAKDRSLVVVEREAETVRHIFERYVALGSVRLLKQELEANGIRSKERVSGAGRKWGGRPLARGALYLMLQNRIYLGAIVHKDQHYPGEHQPIIDRALWDRVQALLAANSVDRIVGTRSKDPSLLAGLIFDGAGHRMTPSHAVKNARRYRYYVSRPLITDGRTSPATGTRIPATDIEQLVTDRLRQFLSSPASVFDAVRDRITDPAEQKRLAGRAAELVSGWAELPPARLRTIVTALVARIEVKPDGVTIEMIPSRVAGALNEAACSESPPDADDRVTLQIAVQLKRAGLGTRMIVPGPNSAQAKPDAGMIKLLAKAHRLQQRVLTTQRAGIGEIAEDEGLSGSYFTRLLRLAWLAPDITEAILEGRHPPSLTARKLMRDGALPAEWDAQRAALGIA